MFDPNNKVNMWYTVHCVGCPFSSGLLSTVFMTHTQQLEVTSSHSSHTQAVSQRWKLTALLIRYISFLTCLRLWASMASKRWRSPLSLMSFPFTWWHTATHRSHGITQTELDLAFLFGQRSFRLLNVVGVMWNTWIWGRGWWDISLDLCCLLHFT